MKNMNVSRKMVVCFLTMILLSGAIGILGVTGMSRLNDANIRMYEDVVVGTEYIGMIRECYQEQRVLIQELALMESDPLAVRSVKEKIRNNIHYMDTYLKGYKNALLTDEMLAAPTLEGNAASYVRYKKAYEAYFLPELSRLMNAAGNIDRSELMTFITSPQAEDMISMMDEGYDYHVAMSKESVQASDALFKRLAIVIVSVIAVSLAISIFFLFYMPITIARPLRHLVQVADAVAVGDMDMPVVYDDRRDEVGHLASAFDRMKEEISKQIAIIEALANADLTVEPVLRSEKDRMSEALLTLSHNLRQVIRDVGAASQSVAMESGSVSAQSQELAQGTTEQAASVEQLSSAFYEISLNTKESAALAGKAATVSDEVKSMAIDGEKMMDMMIAAVQEADAASKSVAKIIKVIEEISFQTNILALNAAVEAAHAGQNGSGFAVVAQEVRSLASKSNESSKETSGLIANALEKVQLGAEIADKTSTSFRKIVDGVLESTKLITDIAKSAEEQAIAIEQINTGIAQVAEVIHINSEAAEKCASAAEKMNSQAVSLENAVRMFKISETSQHPLAGQEEEAEGPVLSEQPQTIKIDLSPSLDNNDFGKY